MSVAKSNAKMRYFTNFLRQIAHMSLLQKMTFGGIVGILLAFLDTSIAGETLVETHCAACHSEEGAEGNFRTAHLGNNASEKNIDFWKLGLERIEAGEMPPVEENQPTSEERQQLITFFRKRINEYFALPENTLSVPPRRLNNREFKNSVRDVLGIEDAGTHQPTDNLIGDSRHNGFDTHGTTLGFSHFHLEQYLDTLRRIVDATILSGEKPDLHFYEISPSEILSAHTSQNTTRPERRGDPNGFDFLDPKQLAYFESIPVIPETGWYDIAIDCIGLDRGLYKSEKTGVYEGDPIRLTIVMGDREQTFDLSDDQITEIRTTQWLAKGTRLRLKYPTDGLTFRGNGNFKFQYAIAGEYIKQNDPTLYKEVADAIKTKPNRRVLKPESWHHWVDYWQGPRPRVLKASVNGPYYDSWPPARQTALLGGNPRVENVKDILKPIAERAWRRNVSDSELTQITNLVRSCQDDLGETEAFKEGIIAILASPAFLLVNSKDLNSEERFTEKLSLFLQSTIPDDALSDSVSAGKFATFDEIYRELKHRFTQSRCDPFLKEFPYAWLELNKINFMSPDPDRYRHYHRKRVSDDMVDEVLAFFQHVILLDLPVTDLIFADYSFVNADLATIYNLNDIPLDSRLRKYTWTDGRRGGFIGMGAFLTLTADSLGTSPIHRAVYVMEKFLGIHPTPPPADVLIKEPDIRSAKTIREVLEAHKSDQTCAACHQRIDPYGWAFENFGPNGSWRDFYSEGAANGNLSKHTKQKEIRIDASANFQNGIEYRDILDFRNHLKTKVNRDRFVRCFITKLLTYANGEEPKNFLEIEKIVQKSASYDHRIVATIAAVIDSPLFRENR